MEFPLETESEGGTQEFLLKLRNSRLTDDALLEEFYNRVIDSYDYAENYLILLVHAAYDIPGNQRTEVKCSMHPMKSMITHVYLLSGQAFQARTQLSCRREQLP